jgi:hypothetical protein
MTLGSGSFTFAPGDSQEFVIAIIAARGDNNLDSITELKRKAAAVKEFYYTGILPTSINDIEITSHPQKFNLHQNYPNPFNAITNFEFRIPNFSHVELSVYNILGQKVATLLDEKRPAGQHKVTFDASGLASGIYYYKLVAGDINLTRKMLLLK